MTETTQSVAKASTSQDFRGMLQTLIESKKLPAHVKTVEDAFTIAQMGKELGFPAMISLHQIIPIQGQLTLSAKAVGALLRKGGVTYSTKEDALWVYPDGTTSEYPIIKEGHDKPIDRRTTIIFTRDGKDEICSFTWNDAKAMGLAEKSNWIKMASQMMYARCISKGANRVGPDLLNGLYMTDEMTDSFNINEQTIKRDEEGFVKEIIIESTK